MSVIMSARSKTFKLIRKAKTNYYIKSGKKLSDPRTGLKTYWTAFKRITGQKTTLFPILFLK